MTHPNNTLALVADIGGTNTRCALANGCNVLKETIRRYSNSEYASLDEVLRTYLADENHVIPAAACVAVAGPVRDGVATMTNLDWTIDRDTLKKSTNSQTVAILNDLQAQGHAIADLDENAFQTVIAGTEPTAHAVRLVVGVGTGFNAAPVFETDAGRFVPPSESGHANLPIQTEQEFRLCRHVSSTHGFPAIEDVLSGRGLERVYSFLCDEADEPAELSAKDIMAACETGDDARATEAAAMFARILGTVCGNLSLIQLPFGGVYLVGGVARALAPYLQDFGFTEAFQDKGRFTSFMSNFSVSVVDDDYAALLGAASHIQSLQNA